MFRIPPLIKGDILMGNSSFDSDFYDAMRTISSTHEKMEQLDQELSCLPTFQEIENSLLNYISNFLSCRGKDTVLEEFSPYRISTQNGGNRGSSTMFKNVDMVICLHDGFVDINHKTGDLKVSIKRKGMQKLNSAYLRILVSISQACVARTLENTTGVESFAPLSDSYLSWKVTMYGGMTFNIWIVLKNASGDIMLFSAPDPDPNIFFVHFDTPLWATLTTVPGVNERRTLTFFLNFLAQHYKIPSVSDVPFFQAVEIMFSSLSTSEMSNLLRSCGCTTQKITAILSETIDIVQNNKENRYHGLYVRKNFMQVQRLNDPLVFVEWLDDLKQIFTKISDARELLQTLKLSVNRHFEIMKVKVEIWSKILENFRNRSDRLSGEQKQQMVKEMSNSVLLMRGLDAQAELEIQQSIKFSSGCCSSHTSSSEISGAL